MTRSNKGQVGPVSQIQMGSVERGKKEKKLQPTRGKKSREREKKIDRKGNGILNFIQEISRRKKILENK